MDCVTATSRQRCGNRMQNTSVTATFRQRCGNRIQNTSVTATFRQRCGNRIQNTGVTATFRQRCGNRTKTPVLRRPSGNVAATSPSHRRPWCSAYGCRNVAWRSPWHNPFLLFTFQVDESSLICTLNALLLLCCSKTTLYNYGWDFLLMNAHFYWYICFALSLSICYMIILLRTLEIMQRVTLCLTRCRYY